MLTFKNRSEVMAKHKVVKAKVKVSDVVEPVAVK